MNSVEINFVDIKIFVRRPTLTNEMLLGLVTNTRNVFDHLRKRGTYQNGTT